MTVDHLHHVGHVVRDIDAAIALYRRMGFAVPPPAFPALPPHPGAPLRAFGVGNSHVNFRSSFVELVTVVDDREGGVVGTDATLVPLQAPAEVIARLRDGITQTADRISTALARFVGLHILVFGAPDVEATVTRLAADGVVHGPITRVQRPGGPEPEAEPVPIDFVEIDDKPGLSPEGRLALVEDWPADSPLLMGDQEHPNGALQLVESVLCVPDADLSAYERRYARYLQRPARSDGPLRVFDLDASRVVIVPSAALGVILPDEVPPGAPGLRRLRVSRPRSFRYPDPSGTSRIPSPELASGRLLPAGQGSPRGSGHLSRCLMRPHSCHDRVAGTVVTRTIVAAPSGHQVRPSGHASPC